MGRQSRGDFVVETVGYCFICMEKVNGQLPQELEESTSIYSLLNLSQYLKIKIRRAFKEEAPIPENLLEQVDRSTLKVALCEECASWNRKLSGMFRQLEKIEIEAASYLQLIQEKIMRADQVEKTGFSTKLNHLGSASGLLGKLEVADVLRNETLQRCSQKLSGAQPQVKIQKLRKEDIPQAKILKSGYESALTSNSKLGSSSPSNYSLSNPTTELHVIKLESNEMEISVEPEHSENNYADDFGEQSEGYEHADMDAATTDDYFGAEQLVTSHKTDQQKYVKNPETGKVKCDLCFKEFAKVFTFQRHYQSVHLNIRFMCKICNKMLTDKDNFKKHQRLAHLKIRFKCDGCSKDFAEKSRLTRHQQSVHLKTKL